MKQFATNDKIIDISSSLQKTSEDIFSDNAANSPDFVLFFFYVHNFFSVIVKYPCDILEYVAALYKLANTNELTN